MNLFTVQSFSVAKVVSSSSGNSEAKFCVSQRDFFYSVWFSATTNPQRRGPVPIFMSPGTGGTGHFLRHWVPINRFWTTCPSYNGTLLFLGHHTEKKLQHNFTKFWSKHITKMWQEIAEVRNYIGTTKGIFMRSCWNRFQGAWSWNIHREWNNVKGGKKTFHYNLSP